MRGPAGALALALLVACGGGTQSATEGTAVEPIAVTTVDVDREQLVEPIVCTGTIAAQKTTNIGPRVDGIIEEIYVKVGDRVAAGDALFRTREIDYRLRLDQARATSRLTAAEAEKARRDRERIGALHEKGVASDQRLDEVQTVYEMTQARRATARAAEAIVRQNLEDTTVRAPYDGVITRRHVDEGAMMRTMMSANSPVVQIMKTDIVVAIIQVPEVHLPRIRLGTPAHVKIDGLDREFESEVYIINDRVEHTSRSIEVRLPIRNPDLAIKPGLFAKAEILPAPREATLIDRGAVLGPPGSRYVFMARDGRASRRAVEVRDLDARRLEVTGGLAAGDRVLAGPLLGRLEDGTPIEIEVADVADAAR
jgi:RND family efflux transporter MFP subunit